MAKVAFWSNGAFWSNIVAAGLIVLAGGAPAAQPDDLSKGVPSREALSRKTALKLAGLATFVSTSCGDLRLDQERFKAAIAALGLSTRDLDEQSTKFAYLEYTMTYKKDVPANCARARAQFGPNGKTLPDLFKVVEAAAPAKAPELETQKPKTPERKTPEPEKP